MFGFRHNDYELDDETIRQIDNFNKQRDYRKSLLALYIKLSDTGLDHSEQKEINRFYDSYADRHIEYLKLVAKHRSETPAPVLTDSTTLSSMSESEKAKLIDDNFKILAITTRQNNEELAVLNNIKYASTTTADKLKAMDDYCRTAPEVKDIFSSGMHDLYIKAYGCEPPTDEEVARREAKNAEEEEKHLVREKVTDAENKRDLAKSHLDLVISEAKTAITKKDADKVIAAKAVLESAGIEDRPAAEAAVTKAIEEAKASYENIDENKAIELDSNVIEARRALKEAEDALEKAEAEAESEH